MFSALDARDAVAGSVVLDLYAGTGALAIEALSRGAERAVLVERSRSVAATARLNVETSGFARDARVETLDAHTFLRAAPSEVPFDLVLCDPPYDIDERDLAATLEALARGTWVSDDGTVVVERALGATLTVPPGLRITWERRFGDTLVAFLQRTPPA
jgi:16S rRNA (guanine966-N2)-methyltransferase